MGFLGRRDPNSEQISAQRMSTLCILSVTSVFVAVLIGVGTSLLHWQQSTGANAFLRTVESQKSNTERLVRLSLMAGQSNARWIPISKAVGQQARADFSSAFTDFQAQHQALRYGDPRRGVPAPTDSRVISALNDVDGNGKVYGAMRELADSISKDDFDLDGDRKKLAGLSKLVGQYNAGIAKAGNVVQTTIQHRSFLAATLLLVCSVIAIIGLFGILATAVQGNLQRLNTMIRKLKDTETRLKDSLEESRTALQLSNMASKRFEQLFGSIPIGCFTCDSDGTIFEWNAAAEKLTGFASHEVYMKSVYETIYAQAQREKVAGMLQRVMAGEAIMGVELEEVRQDGTHYSVMVNLLPMRGGNDEITSVICANADITVLKEREKELADSREELRLANSRLHALATTDGLTGLNNHRSFQEQFELEFNAAKTKGQPLSVVLLDVDRFKQYNDSFGHMAGDEVLREVSRVLRDTTPDGFMVARYGGEEFVIIMPHVSRDVAMQVTEMIRLSLAERQWPNREVTASFGVSTYDDNYKDAASMIAEADQALYSSKEHGRNRVTHCDTMPERPERRAA